MFVGSCALGMTCAVIVGVGVKGMDTVEIGNEVLGVVGKGWHGDMRVVEVGFGN